MEKRFADARACWTAALKDEIPGHDFLPFIADEARRNTDPAPIAFGTSGWRGETGSDFTFHNLRIVATALSDVVLTEDPALQSALGVAGPDDVRRRGVVVGHDNRFLGPEFAREIMGIFGARGIPSLYAGEATTPELSAAIERTGAACSINLTPSHNPANWSGLKFNPRDGGPAGPEITSVVAETANRLSENNAEIRSERAALTIPIDPVGLYREFLAERNLIDLVLIRRFLREQDVLLVVDHIHGATRGRPEALFGEGPWLKTLRTTDDPLFGGVAPEPSAANLQGVVEALGAARHSLKLGVIMDPDGDRIRFTDGRRDITMNHFGALALHFLCTKKDRNGTLVKSVATSNFGSAVAKGLGVPVVETAVGFKNFRPYMLPESEPRAVVTYEESDGISAFGNTLEKDATFGLLLALEMMARTGKNIGDYLDEIEDTFGHFYPERAGIAVDRRDTGAALKKKLGAVRDHLIPGAVVEVGPVSRTVADVVTVDGTKVVLDDGSWFLIRPSGTEPKVRFYVESRSEEETDHLIRLAERITRDALSR